PPRPARAPYTTLFRSPFASQAGTLTGVKDRLREGQIVLDACVPLATAVGGKPLQLMGVWHGSAAQQAAALVPEGVRVVSGLHTLDRKSTRLNSSHVSI